MCKGTLSILLSLVGVAVAVVVALLGNISLLPQYRPPGWQPSQIMAYLVFAILQPPHSRNLFGVQIDLLSGRMGQGQSNRGKRSGLTNVGQIGVQGG